MIELRTSPTWRIVYWAITAIQAVLFSGALARGSTLSIVVGLILLAMFFVLALQSRSSVHVGPSGIADERVMIRRAWSWDDVASVEVRAPSLFRPDVLLRNEGGQVLPLNMRGLVARRDDEQLSRLEAIDAITRIARGHRVPVEQDA